MINNKADFEHAKPFVKWVGGKGKLISELEKYFPKKINRYFEPFVGGGALFFHVIQKYNVTFSNINDINKKLIVSYKQIQKNPNKIIKILTNIETEYKKKSAEERKKYFYFIREKYNEEKLEDDNITAYLIFLNKTCFNGMYRENSKGQYNVPFGDQKNPTICDKKNIINVSKSLKNTIINNQNFEESVKSCKRGDFIYFDPPYYPINTTSSFTTYHQNKFGPNEQKRLGYVFNRLVKKGCYVMLSNSNTQFIRNLYKEFHIYEIYAARSINSKGNGRGKIKEIVTIGGYTI